MISNLFLQWLVKKAIERKEEMGDYIREFSVSQFNKYHSTPQVCIMANLHHHHHHRHRIYSALLYHLDNTAPTFFAKPLPVSRYERALDMR